jgi:hypothetical protein
MKRIAISRCLIELSNNEAHSGLEISYLEATVRFIVTHSSLRHLEATMRFIVTHSSLRHLETTIRSRDVLMNYE